MSRPAATPTQLVDDARVRVTRYVFAPGQETGWHTHEMDYVVTTLTPCVMLLEAPDGGAEQVEVAAGTTYSRASGVRHNVVNAGDAEMCFVEVEIKRD